MKGKTSKKAKATQENQEGGKRMETQLTCKERVSGHLKGRIEDIDKLWKMYCNDPDAYDEDLGNFNEYGLAFDYVAPHTLTDQHRGYFRYQLSWGGPSDEFRFYCDENLNIDRIEYWFLDWFDGAKKNLHGHAFQLMEEIYQDFKECGVIHNELEKARE